MSFPKISLFLLFPLLLLAACNENHAIKKEYFYLEEDHLTWLPADTLPEVLLMRDNHGITYSFFRKEERHDFNKSWTSFLGINTRMSFNEYRSLGYGSSFNGGFDISLTAGFPPYGDELYVFLNGTAFAWDFNFKTLHRVEYGDLYFSKLMADDGYEETEKILSTVEFLDTLRTSERLYHDILHFSFRDLPRNGQTHPFSVVDIYLARHWGLVRYDLLNGIRYERVYDAS